MPSYIFDPPPQPAVPILGEAALYPVRRILCVGRNYAAHRREMGGGEDDPDPPFFFSKPADAIVPSGGDVPYASMTHNLHYEMELVVALGSGGSDVAAADALGLVFGYAAGVDMTRRDLQSAYRDKGQPWEGAKAFDFSAPISPIKRWTGPAPQGRIKLSVNGAIKQDAVVSDMIWGVAAIISEASKLWRLAPGDLIYTGTPDGVGPVVKGDLVEGEVEGVGTLSFKIT
jgi:fumarylpyruvate hydrolase